MRTLLLILALTGCLPDEDNVVVFGGVDDIPNTLSFAVVEGSDPADQTIEISNTGTCDLDFSAEATTSDAAIWLQVSPTSGSVLASANTSLTVEIDSALSALSPGGYTGTIALAATCQDTGNPAVGSPANVSINLSVTANNAILGVSDDDLEFDLPTIGSATWTSMSTAGAPVDRGRHAIAWSGYELYVVGGLTNGGTGNALATGGAYNPYTNTWRSIADMPFAGGYAEDSGAWAADRFVVLGASEVASSPSSVHKASIYNPTSNTWSTASGTGASITERWDVPCVISDGDLVWFWGGDLPNGSPVTTNVAAVFAPDTDTTLALSDTNVPADDSAASGCALTGTELLVVTDDQFGRYDIASNTWTTTTLPSGIWADGAAWTGKKLVVLDNSNHKFHQWTQSTNQWTSSAAFTWPSTNPFVVPPPVWTGREVLFTGYSSTDQYSAYDPETAAFTTLGSDLSSGGRFGYHAHAWTGDRLLTFGGLSALNPQIVVAPGGGVLQ